MLKSWFYNSSRCCEASFSRKQPRLQAEQCFRVLLPECSWVYSYGSCGQDRFFETQITEIAADTAIVAFVWIFCPLFEHFMCEDRHKKAMNQHLGPWLCVFCFYFRLGFRCNLCIFWCLLKLQNIQACTFFSTCFQAFGHRIVLWTLWCINNMGDMDGWGSLAPHGSIWFHGSPRYVSKFPSGCIHHHQWLHFSSSCECVSRQQWFFPNKVCKTISMDMVSTLHWNSIESIEIPV